jgi:hypothetical protein
MWRELWAGTIRRSRTVGSVHLYGDPTDIEAPRQIRAGLRLSF